MATRGGRDSNEDLSGQVWGGWEARAEKWGHILKREGTERTGWLLKGRG